MLRSLLLLPAFAATVWGQGAPLPESTTAAAATTANPTCNGCYIVAGVAQVIFADYTVVQTMTAVASEQVNRNSTVSTTFVNTLGSFSFNSGGIISGTPITAAYIPLTGTVITVGGATLTSPTAYNVFTAYTEYTLQDVGGNCQTVVSATSQLPTGLQYPLGQDIGASEILVYETDFVNSIGRPTCMIGQPVPSTIVPVPVSTTTTTSTTRSTMSPTPVAMTSSTSSAASSTSSQSSSSSISIIQVSAGSSPPIVTGAASAVHAPAFASNLLVALFALPGLGAWLL